MHGASSHTNDAHPLREEDVEAHNAARDPDWDHDEPHLAGRSRKSWVSAVFVIGVVIVRFPLRPRRSRADSDVPNHLR